MMLAPEFCVKYNEQGVLNTWNFERFPGNKWHTRCGKTTPAYDNKDSNTPAWLCCRLKDHDGPHATPLAKAEFATYGDNTVTAVWYTEL